MKPKIIYIMGHSRSGSTIFDIMLSNASNVVGVGELINLESLGFIKNEYCSCGNRIEECDFWSKIKKDVVDSGFDNFEKQHNLIKSVDGHKRFFYEYLEKTKTSIEIADSYLNYNKHLFSSIIKHSNANSVVDSSKMPTRGYFLSLMEEFDVYLLHIVRDPRAVCWSLHKSIKKDLEKGVQRDMPGTPIMKTIKSWLGNAVMSLKIKQQLSDKYMLINYDRLIQDNEAVLDEISKFTDVDFSEVAQMIKRDDEFIKFHTVAGNRLRILGAKSTINATKKTKNVQLYTLKKKYIDKLDKDNLDFVKLNVTVFIKLFKELHIIKDIKTMENTFVNDRYEECVNYNFNFFEV